MLGGELGRGENIIVTIDSDLEDLVPGFLESIGGAAQRLRQALPGRDLDAVRAIGHDMKGSGAGYGFDAITEMGAGLERAARAGDTERIGVLLDELADYLARVQVEYE